MLRRSANSQKRQKPETKPKGRQNRPLPTDKPLQRKAPLAQLPVLRLVNGSAGKESGTRRSFDTDASSGRKAR